MGKKFFSGWVLWQQMTFVLACGIVATIFLGLCKLQYDRRKLRKYDKVEKGKAAQTPEMLESQPISESKDEIPFGIRAIESGIEVDGVWISRSNTPAGSRRSSVNEFKIPHSLTGSQLELPKAVHDSSSRDSSRAPTMNSAFDRAVSAERIPTNESRSSSPGRESSSPSRGRPPFASDSHASNSQFTRNSSTLHALEGMPSAPFSVRYEPKSTHASSADSGKSSIRNSDELDHFHNPEGRPYEAAYINSKYASTSTADPRTDLNLLQSHRLSHVAETGQLTPRVRRPGNSGEWASVADSMRSPQEISTLNGIDYFVPRQKTPSPPLNPLKSPPELPALSASKLNGHALNQARQTVPLLEAYSPEATQLPETYQPRGPQHKYEEEPTHYEVQTPQNQRQSQVIRKVNSGFEILRPGTFGEPTSPEDETPKSEKRQSKRLQKKRRSTNGSTSSKFVEQV